LDDAVPNEQELNKRKLGILRPLQVRDFRLLWTGMTVSFLGDGIYIVALAWQVYELSNAPSALSVVAVAWSLPMVLFLLAGGVLSDRVDRRKVMIAGDVLRGSAVLAMGSVAVFGTPRIWHFIVFGAIYGVGQALFNPAFGAVVPDIVPKDMILQANSLDSLVRQAAERLFGPAIGGFTVAAFGAGNALLIDAGTFVFSAFMISMIRKRPRVQMEFQEKPLAQVKEGFRFVRSQPWLIVTLIWAPFTLLFALGPFEILLPYFVKNDLNGSAQSLGYVITAGGVGAVVASLFMARGGIPRKHILFMYLSWGVGLTLLAPYYFATELWHVMVLEFVAWSLFSAGQIVWMTLLHRLVPPEFLGRTVSLDWMMATALIPISFALVGPISEWIGVRETFLWSGILSAVSTVIVLFWPGLRDTERDGSIHPIPEQDEPKSELISA
jgi:MFS family permease